MPDKPLTANTQASAETEYDAERWARVGAGRQSTPPVSPKTPSGPARAPEADLTQEEGEAGQRAGQKRLRQFRRPHCGSIRIDETYIRVREQWRYLYRAVDKHGQAVDFLLTANRDLDAAKRFFRKMLQDQPLLAPDRIGTDGAGPYPPAIAESRAVGLLPRMPTHYVTKHLQQGIESDHFRVKRAMPRTGGFRSFNTARRTVCGFEAMLWLRKGFGFVGAWTVREQNQLLAYCFGLPAANKA